jgi:methylated-DNA-[protein]-cysteine S-methyltransferase
MHKATFMTDLGPVALEADDLGLTYVGLPGPDPKSRPAAGKQLPVNPLLRDAALQILEYLSGERTVFALPLSVAGTEFQEKVWQIIREIPYGATLSYGTIARRLGGVAKARAVGGAAHANRLPLFIPCHRVIGGDGSLTGFGSGLELKEKLLALERRQVSGPGRNAG